jgi:hypothetical protein
MKTTFLDFEQQIAELESKIEELRFVQDESSVDISDEIKTLSEKSLQLTKDVLKSPDILKGLTRWITSVPYLRIFMSCMAIVLLQMINRLLAV